MCNGYPSEKECCKRMKIVQVLRMLKAVHLKSNQYLRTCVSQAVALLEGEGAAASDAEAMQIDEEFEAPPGDENEAGAAPEQVPVFS